MAHLLGVLFLGLSVLSVTSETWTSSVPIKNGNIYWKLTGTKITFRMEVSGANWLGLGWNPHEGKMKNTDMVISDKSGVGDYFSFSTSAPDRDRHSDVENAEAGKRNGKTWMQFDRKLNTRDDDDIPISQGKMYLIWAFGESNQLAYHRSNKGSEKVKFKIPATASAEVRELNWKEEVQFRGGKIKWSIYGDEIRVRMEARSRGWIGIGFGPEDHKMKNADMVIATGPRSTLSIGDYFSEGMKMPKLDRSNDINPIAVGRDKSLTFMEFSRKRDTGDPDDTVIDGKMEVIWAYGDHNDLSYHAGNRGLLELDFSDVQTASIAGLTTESSDIPTTWDGTRAFPGGSFSWKATWDKITMNVSAEVSGWLAIGWSPDDGKMLNADMVILTGTDSSDLIAQDYFSTGMKLPNVDSQQDVKVLKMSKESSKMEMVFEKNLKTNDEEDKEIKLGEEVVIIWAYGSGSKVSYHEENRGSFRQILVDEEKIQTPEDAFYKKSPDGYYYKDGVAYERVHAKYYPTNADGYAQIGDLYYKHSEIFMSINGEYIPATEEGFYIKDGLYWKNGVPFGHKDNLYFEVNTDGFYTYNGFSWKDDSKYLRVDNSYCKANEDGYCFQDNYFFNGIHKFGKKGSTYLRCDENGFYFYEGFWWKDDLRYLMKDGRYFRA